MTSMLLTASGTGLVTGLTSQVEITTLPSGAGIVFQVDNVEIPATPDFVISTDRGVTLGRNGKMLSIVEHFLSACAITGHRDLKVQVSGAPELPLFDGSAAIWVELLREQFGLPQTDRKQTRLKETVTYQDSNEPETQLTAFPAETLQITYLVNFNHPDLTRRWWCWQPSDGTLTDLVAPARTFGFVSELPILQARGLAKGVSLDNTLGLTDEGGYTSPLRMPDEPIRHKILDFIGDMMLCGLLIQDIQAHFVIYNAGHTSHIAFGKHLQKHLAMQSTQQEISHGAFSE
jgi:UDP-3-O-[3-hydroxymyristoyl] N-acetylglucosamine deacetylase